MIFVSKLMERLSLIDDVKKFCTEELGIIPNCSFTKIVDTPFSRYNVYICPNNHIGLQKSDTGIVQYNSLVEVNFIRKVYKKLKDQKPFSDADIWSQEVMAVIERKESREVASDHEFPNEEKICEASQITQNDLNISKTLLVGLIIHENIHIQLCLKDIHVEYSIEETMADHLAYHGSRLFYKNNRHMLNNIDRHNAHEEYFYDWCNGYIKKLNKAYQNSQESGREILSQAQKEYKTYFKGRDDINNAFFMMWLPYVKHRKSVRKILKEERPREHIEKISRCNCINTLKELESVIKS